MSESSNITNREAIKILIAIAKGDFETSFLINVSVRKERERLIVLALLNIEYRLSAIIDY
jgi:hypothetical protein